MILVYVHEVFYELGLSLCNLFELADDVFLDRPIDAVYLLGVPGTALDALAPMPTVFYDDPEHHVITPACPNKDQFGYFGYLKKMVLTLHNIKIMKLGKMPYHGAMVRIVTKGDRSRQRLSSAIQGLENPKRSKRSGSLEKIRSRR